MNMNTSALQLDLPRTSPGLLRRYDLRTVEGRAAGLDLWSSSRTGREFYNEGRPAQLRATGGDVRMQTFATPILLPSSLPERAARPS